MFLIGRILDLWIHLTLDLIERDIDIDKIGRVKATSQLLKTVDEGSSLEVAIPKKPKEYYISL
jgi:hypothetical protein